MSVKLDYDIGPLKLGDAAKDKVTGFSGILVAYVVYLAASPQWSIQPPIKSTGEWVDSRYFDEDRIERDSERMAMIGFRNSERVIKKKESV